MASAAQIDPFDLLGQTELYPPQIVLPGRTTPKLEIAWDSFHQNFLSNIPAFFQSGDFKGHAPADYLLRDCSIERRLPGKALLIAAGIHLSLFVIPWPELPGAPKHNPALENTELTWSGPIEDLPLVNMAREKKTRPVESKPEHEAAPAEGADAFHPRQRIITDPVKPTHPRQTLVNPAAPPEAPKLLPEMPNVVQLAATSAPPRPHIEIGEQALAKLKPHATKSVATTDLPSTELPNVETRPAELSIAASQNGPAKPKLEINAGSAPRVGASKQEGEIAAAPEVVPAAVGATNGTSGTLIALSATPAPPTPVIPVPDGNLAARVAISPEGKRAGNPGTSDKATPGGGGTTAASNALGSSNGIGISISGGSPKPNAAVSGLGGPGRFTMAKPQALLKRPDPNAVVEDTPERSGPPNFAALPPGAPPEQIFTSRRVYSMNVNMPNLNSASGSWIIHFSELHLAGTVGHAGAVSAPVPVRKVDPKYPSILIEEHVQGEVILYGVIRQNGTVDSIQLVKGIDERLDGNAMSAFSQWKFEPATRDGQAVDLEAIVHIPFHAPARQ